MLPSWVFGAFLLAFVVAIGVFAWFAPRQPKARTLLFVLLYLPSLAFALGFPLLEWRRSGLKFAELGHYYPLNLGSNATNQQGLPSVVIGDVSQQANYVLPSECSSEPCFRGRIELRFLQRPGGPNVLYWQSSLVTGTVRATKEPSGLWESVRNLIWVSWTEDGNHGIDLSGDKASVLLRLDSPGDDASPLIIPITIELDPKNAPPRITLELPEARIVDLPDSSGRSADSIYLTSNPSAALRSSTGDGYVPTITVGSVDPSSDVAAFLEHPSADEAREGDNFIVNNGLTRGGYSFGKRFYIGTESGVVATVVSGSGISGWQYALACIVLWTLPFVFFLPIAHNSKLFLLIPLIQMLLAVRLILALRVFIWSPYNAEAFESGVLAVLLVPLLLFIGCFAAALQNIGSYREQERWKKGWWGYLFRQFPPVIYQAFALVTFLVLIFIFQLSSPLSPARTNLPFHDWTTNLRTFALLLVLPLAVYGIALILDSQLRGGKKRDKYVRASDDPITYQITRGPEVDNRRPAWSRRHTLAVCLVLVVAILLGGTWLVTQLIPSEWIRGCIWIGAVSLGTIVLWRSRLLFIDLSRTISVAVANLAIILGTAAALVAIKLIWNTFLYKGLGKLTPTALSIVFEILILILTMRLLATFFGRWSDATSAFRFREFFELCTVFLTPPLMFFASFIASRDTGSLVVHWPALVGATLLVTGLWPLWKVATGRRHAVWALLIAFGVVLLVFELLNAFFATEIVTRVGPHSTLSHRMLLHQGTGTALTAAETGGLELIAAIEQNWRMMDYAAEGAWKGVGYGNSPIRGHRTFQRITLDDLVFSAYVLAEHGTLGGIGLLLLYLMIFIIVISAAWQSLRKQTLHLAFAGALGLMLLFPALYMAAANVGVWLFTGQNIPLLGLRSDSELLRTGIVLMLLAAVLRPLAKEAIHQEKSPPWFELVWNVRHVLARGIEQKARWLKTFNYDRFTAEAASAVNIALVVLLLAIAALFPILGAVHASGNQEYTTPLDLSELKTRAINLIKYEHIWFEPIETGKSPGSNCRGGSSKNIPAPNNLDPSTAYQLCSDDDVSGIEDGDTFTDLIRQWNSGIDRDKHRGNTLNEKHDAGQFFQLDTSTISRIGVTGSPSNSLTVNRDIYRWVSPFRPAGWNGSLIEADSAITDGGVLVGSGILLPLRASPFGFTPAFGGFEHVQVNLDQPRTYEPSRGFAVFETERDSKTQRPIFEVETVSGAKGGLLRSGSADFDLFINGCSVSAGPDDKCKLPAITGTAPPLRIDFGDVIAYAPKSPTDQSKRVARYVFVYSNAQLGMFSHMAWLNGEFQRVYPQHESFPMARQIAEGIAASASGSDSRNRSVALTLDAALNRQVYDLLRQWRRQLDARVPIRVPDSRRRMSVTLMDSYTGRLLALASDNGTPYDPNTDEQQRGVNLNLENHRVGSAIKPFTAAATLGAFPNLHQLTLVDLRSDRGRVFGLPIGGKNGIQIRDGTSQIDWRHFLPYSDNLYAVSLGLLGMTGSQASNGLPHFTDAPNPIPPIRLTLRDSGSSLGLPVWPSNLFPGGERVDWAQQTPLKRQLEELFAVRAGSPSYGNDIKLWSELERMGLVSSNGLSNMNGVSAEIPNFALADVRNLDELRSVLLGGEISDLPRYGRVGGSLSNVYLAQSLARITTGRAIEAQIVVDPTQRGSQQVGEWFAGALRSTWRRALLLGLEGVARESGPATARESLGQTVRQINFDRGIRDFDVPYTNPAQYVVGSGRTYFTVLCKTGTIDPDDTPDGNGPLISDSIFIFTAGIWDDSTQTFTRSVTGAIYLEQSSEGQAQRFAADLLHLLNVNPRFNWSRSR